MTETPRMTPDHERPAAERHPLARPRVLRALRWGGLIAAALLVAAGLLVDSHPHFAIEDVAGFFAGFGLLAAFVLLALARLWGAVFQREDAYYD